MAKIEEYQQDSNLQTKCQLLVCLKLVVVKYASSQNHEYSIESAAMKVEMEGLVVVAVVVGSVSNTIPAMTTLDKPTIKPIAG